MLDVIVFERDFVLAFSQAKNRRFRLQAAESWLRQEDNHRERVSIAYISFDRDYLILNSRSEYGLLDCDWEYTSLEVFASGVLVLR